MKRQKTLSISLPADANGMLPRQCPTCKKHFSIDEKVYDARAHLNLRCPYCKWIAPLNEFTTVEQNAYVRAVAENEARKMAEDLVGERLDEMFDNLKSSPYLKVERTGKNPSFARNSLPSPFPLVQLSTTVCAACKFSFSVLSETNAPFCPLCR